MISAEEIARNYQHYEDEKIEYLALNSRGLRKEAVAVLKDEIIRRNLDTRLLQWIDFETIEFESFEKEQLIHKISNLICPNCNSFSDLKAYQFITVVSFITECVTNEYTQIICNQCASKERKNSMLQTFLLGWWSLKGLFVTPITLINSIISIFREDAQSTQLLNEFIDSHRAVLRYSLQNKNLDEIITLFNQNQLHTIQTIQSVQEYW